MGVLQSTTLNTDPDGKRTSAEYADRGDGTSKWLLWSRTGDGGDATQGAKADAAVTDPTLSGSVVALLKGILSFLRVSAAGVGKAEDAAHASGDTGIMPLAVRRDTAAASSGTSGDYEPLQTDSLGRLRVTTPAVRAGGTAITASSGSVANTAAVATLAAGGAGVRTYITGFVLTASGATGASVVVATVTGLANTMSFVFTEPAGTTEPATPLIVTFPEPIPASADNTAIVVTLPALGAGNTDACATAFGFQR